MYELGVLIAFVLWAYTTVMMVVNANSQLSRNLRKVGMRLSWLTADPVPADVRAGTGWRVFAALVLVGFGLVSIVLSWVNVAWWVGMFIYRKSKDAGAPAPVKELRWKMRNVDLTAEQITSAMESANAAVVPRAA